MLVLEIGLLGGFDLGSTERLSHARLGPKSKALLAILAVARGQPVPRGRLAGLLWGERDEDRARHSLSQALTSLRAALGPAASALLAERDHVRLAEGHFWVDVEAFECAVRGDQLEEAARLYRGDFLDGLAVREPGFEEWLLTERYRLGELAADAFARLSDARIASGAVDAALDAAKRLVAIAPLDEGAHARLIRLYGARGRRGLADTHYARCSELLRRELGEAPGEELEAALREAHRRPPDGSAAPAVRGRVGRDLALLRRDTAWNGRRWLAPVTVSAAALLLVTFAWMLNENGRTERERGASALAPSLQLPAQPSIAVLPFVDLSDDAEQEYLVDGMTRDIITDLSKFSTLFVISAGSAFQYKGQRYWAEDVARELGVRYVLEGSVQRSGNSLRLNASLVDAATGRQVWAERFERPVDDVLAAQKDISRDVVTLIGSERGLLVQAELDRIARKPTSSPAAYELFQRGVHHRNLESREDTVIARRLFERAVALDPSYARALANLGLTYLDDIWGDWTDSRELWLQKAKDLARRATEVDASEPTGYMALGLVRFLQSEHDQAIPLLEKALALNPNDDHTLHALGYVLFYSGASPANGVPLLEEMRRRNPHYPEVVLRDLALGYLLTGRAEDALEALAQVARRHRPSYWLFKAASHVRLDQIEEARAAVTEALRLDPDLTLEDEHERRLAMGFGQTNAELLTSLLRQAGLPSSGDL